ncbi:MAG: macro domain-containing protein, partial [Planctomycetes bacterium]|nr:macro domain-containing protein [Planctomycetota bacterium]
QREVELLASAYKTSLSLASQYKLKSVAFPSISTGAYGYPLDDAATVALKTAINYLKTHTGIELARFVLFGKKAYQAYDKALQALVK